MDHYLQIRLLHRDGLSLRQIAKKLGHSRDTVKKALVQATPLPYTRTSPAACSKWEVTCSQRYMREENAIAAITEALRLVALPAEWTDWLLAAVNNAAVHNFEDAASAVRDLKEKLKAVDERLDRLMCAYIDKVITLSEYKTAKNKLMDEKRFLAENLTSVDKQRNTAFEPLKSFILATKQAKMLSETGNPEEQRDFFKTITSNPNVFNRELRFEPRGAWQLVIRQGSFVQQNTAPAIAGAVFCW